MRVISGVSYGIARFLTLATPFSFVLLVSGCDPEGYPAALKYPVRTDIIVNSDKLRDDELFHPDPPGQLDENLRKYKAKFDEDKKGEAFDPANLTATERSAIGASLEEHFGTPAKPRVSIKPAAAHATLDPEELTAAFQEATKDLQLDDATLEAGSKLYRRHCQHCHGVSGNGRGPTAAWIHPHPRDYRKGQFKFISTGKQAPSRDDLYRVLKNGIDYTSMPSFGLLADGELDSLISYVIHLSLRGQAEEATMTALLRKEQLQVAGDDATVDVYLQDKVRFVVLQNKIGDQLVKGNGWAAANKTVLTPSPAPAADAKTREEDIVKGYKLFIGDSAGCLKCHKDFGRGSLYRYDVWGTLVQPRNLTAGVYRGGRRPIDYFWRIKGGIKPSTMPAVDELTITPEEKKEIQTLRDQIDKESDDTKKAALEANLTKRIAEITDPRIWQIVAFIQAVPYPYMLPDQVRKEVYPSPVSMAKQE